MSEQNNTSSTPVKTCIGIDISKATFDLAFQKQGSTGFTHHKLPNTEEGFVKLITLLRSESIQSTAHAVMEASGPYYLRLATFLADQRIAVSVVNPLIIRRFCQMRMTRAKTDKKDAEMIARYAQSEQPGLWTPDTEGTRLRAIQSTLELLQKQRAMLARHQEALSELPWPVPASEKAIAQSLQSLDEQIAELEKEMEAEAKKSYGDTLGLVQSVPGIGKKTAIMLLCLSGGFKKFKTAKQLASYFGMCPRVFESGTSVKGRGGITKMGMSGIRKLLYLCAWSAKAHNNACRELYERLLKNGKAKMVALIAVANKLLRQAFAVVTTQTAYKP